MLDDLAERILGALCQDRESNSQRSLSWTRRIILPAQFCHQAAKTIIKNEIEGFHGEEVVVDRTFGVGGRRAVGMCAINKGKTHFAAGGVSVADSVVSGQGKIRSSRALTNVMVHSGMLW